MKLLSESAPPIVYVGGSAKQSAYAGVEPGRAIVTWCAALTTPPYEVGSASDALDAPWQLFCDAGTKIATQPSAMVWLPEKVTTYGIRLTTEIE